MTVQKERKKRRIPEFRTIEEEAEFWDTHDTTDYEDEFKPVKVRFADKLFDRVTIPVDADTLAQLDALAREEELNATALARRWVLERLKQEIRGARQGSIGVCGPCLRHTIPLLVSAASRADFPQRNRLSERIPLLLCLVIILNIELT